MTKEFPMTNAEFSLITRASGGESRGLPSRRQRGFHRLATLCWERIGHWGYWSFAPNANPLEMSRNRLETCATCQLAGLCQRPLLFVWTPSKLRLHRGQPLLQSSAHVSHRRGSLFF